MPLGWSRELQSDSHKPFDKDGPNCFPFVSGSRLSVLRDPFKDNELSVGTSLTFWELPDLLSTYNDYLHEFFTFISFTGLHFTGYRQNLLTAFLYRYYSSRKSSLYSMVSVGKSLHYWRLKRFSKDKGNLSEALKVHKRRILLFVSLTGIWFITICS